MLNTLKRAFKYYELVNSPDSFLLGIIIEKMINIMKAQAKPGITGCPSHPKNVRPGIHFLSKMTDTMPPIIKEAIAPAEEAFFQ